jgi:hypothetical protein
MNYQKVILTATATTLSALALHAATAVTIVVTGSTAFRSVTQDRAQVILHTTPTLVNSDNTKADYVGGSYTNGLTIYSPVTVRFSYSGSAQGLIDVANQNNVVLADNSNGKPQLAFSDVFPVTAGLTEGAFNRNKVGVVPFVFFKNKNSTALSALSNLTQRQATTLFATAGTIPAPFYCTSGTDNDIVYLAGRWAESGTRLTTDSVTYFTGTPANYYRDAGGNWVTGVVNADFNGGYVSGGKLATAVNAAGAGDSIIGYQGTADAAKANLQILTYNGVAESDDAVENGRYEFWGYEHAATKKTGTGAPTLDQQAIITALINSISDNTYQTDVTGKYFLGGFTPQSAMNVERTTDGGPISSLIY